MSAAEAAENEAHGFAFASSAATDIGHVREVNEDSFLASEPVFLVADGMGGHNAGEVASAIVVDEFLRLVGTHTIELDAVADALVAAYERIASIDDPSTRSAGTTVAMVTLTEHEGEPQWLVMNLGDSRVYAIRNGEFSQVSVDHSVVQELVDRGEITAEQARIHPYRNMITRALGAGPDARPDFWLLDAHVGDTFLLCSDGVSGEVADDRIREILTEEAGEISAAQRLVDEALARGGRDNATAVIVTAVPPAEARIEGDTIFTTVDRASLPARIEAADPSEDIHPSGRSDTGDISDTSESEHEPAEAEENDT